MTLSLAKELRLLHTCGILHFVRMTVNIYGYFSPNLVDAYYLNCQIRSLMTNMVDIFYLPSKRILVLVLENGITLSNIMGKRERL